MTEAKTKWNTLAKEDARYYILTDKSVSASEEAFSRSGEGDVRNYFLEDKILQGAIGQEKKAKVLEIGCGIGRLSEFIAPHVAELYGVDISEEMISEAKKRLGQHQNITFLATDGMSFPIPDESVEAVFSFIVFQHMPTIEVIRKNIEEVSRVLKLGGVAKIQLRGIPVSKDSWYYGPSFNKAGVERLLGGARLQLLKLEGEGQKYLWVWLKKL
ncbi:MAG: class I SAM-dependent methyltransferase [Patescibacteria group bacterium]